MGKSKKHIIPQGQLNFFEELGFYTSDSNSNIPKKNSKEKEKIINKDKLNNSTTKKEDSPSKLISENSTDDSLASESNIVLEPYQKDLEEVDLSISKSDIESKALTLLDENKSDNKSRLKVFVPDRFESLERRTEKKKDDLKTIIVEVKDALSKLKNTYKDMQIAGRGAFWILRGDSGSGKSTFLHTASFFLPQVETISLQEHESISTFLRNLDIIESESLKMRIVVIENREALTDYSESELEKDLHSINRFIRSIKGEGNLLVWPCNCDDLERILINLSEKIGADALLGIEKSSYRFTGPLKTQYIRIATQTIETLNEGATLVDLGISEERAKKLEKEVATIGKYLTLLRQEITKNQRNLEELLSRERFKMWTVVIAVDEPEYEVSALTRGSLSQADITKLLSSTEANIVQELKETPDKIGILGTVLDSKIIYLPITTALSIARKYADDDLREKMKLEKMKSSNVSADKTAEERFMKSELAKAFQSVPRGLGKRGYKSKENSQKAFESLLKITKNNDILVNKTIGKVLKECKLVDDFQTEVYFKGKIDVKSDLLCRGKNFDEPVRLEIMWRGKRGASCAQIANYVLTKLHNYGKAIGLLD